MHIEIEAKLKVDSLTEVARRLKSLGAEFFGNLSQADTHFDDAKRTLRKSDSALRLRRQSIGRKKQAMLAFKGPRQKGRFKQRQEIQFEVSCAVCAEKLINAIGYNKTMVIRKKRQVWQLDGCEVALDELPLLGTFVEIEGPSEKKIADVQKKLGLEDLPHIPESYAALMQKQIRRRGRKSSKVFF